MNARPHGEPFQEVDYSSMWGPKLQQMEDVEGYAVRRMNEEYNTTQMEHCVCFE